MSETPRAALVEHRAALATLGGSAATLLLDRPGADARGQRRNDLPRPSLAHPSLPASAREHPFEASRRTSAEAACSDTTAAPSPRRGTKSKNGTTTAEACVEATSGAGRATADRQKNKKARAALRKQVGAVFADDASLGRAQLSEINAAGKTRYR